MSNSTNSPVSPVLNQYIGSRGGLDSELPSEKRRRFSVRKLIKRALIAVVLAVFIGGGVVGWKLYEDAAKATGDKNPLQLFGLFKPATLTETNGRVNILLAGYSVDDPGHQGAELTDSIMVVSINPVNKNAVLISIPRDMWVDIPGFGYQKINAAYEDGQSENFSQAGYDSGGMGLLEEVVQQDFGIQADYYGLLDYSAFKDAVNAVGGVSVDIQSPDPRGLYDPNADLNLPTGEVTLNGQEALDLARARGDGPGAYGFPDGDFNRTQHQQQLLIALKDKAHTSGVLSNPIKLVQLANAVGNNFKSDMSLPVMNTLYKDTNGINNSSIQSVTLNDYNGKDLLQSYDTPDGEDALIPAAGWDNYTQIQEAISTLLSTPANN